MSTYTPEQFDRLPKWAKALVRQAALDIEYAKKVERATEEAAAVAALHALDGGRPPEGEEYRGAVTAFREEGLGEYVPVGREQDKITFVGAGGRENRGFHVGFRNGVLEVACGSGPMVIRASSSNKITLHPDPNW